MKNILFTLPNANLPQTPNSKYKVPMKINPSQAHRKTPKFATPPSPPRPPFPPSPHDFLSALAFFLIARSFLFTLSFLSALLAAPVALVALSVFSSTSTIHWLSAALFAPL